MTTIKIKIIINYLQRKYEEDTLLGKRMKAHAHTHTHTHALSHTQTHAHPHTHTRARTHTRTHTHTRAQTHARAHARTHSAYYVIHSGNIRQTLYFNSTDLKLGNSSYFFLRFPFLVFKVPSITFQGG